MTRLRASPLGGESARSRDRKGLDQKVENLIAMAAASERWTNCRSLNPKEIHVKKRSSVHWSKSYSSRAGRYERVSDNVLTLTGQGPLSVQEFVSKNAATLTASTKAA
jgi:hypothetical protein